MDFFEFFSTEFAACSKPQNRDNHRKASYPRAQQRDQGAGLRVEPRSFDQGRRKNDAFTHSATLPTRFFFVLFILERTKKRSKKGQSKKFKKKQSKKGQLTPLGLLGLYACIFRLNFLNDLAKGD